MSYLLFSSWKDDEFLNLDPSALWELFSASHPEIEALAVVSHFEYYPISATDIQDIDEIVQDESLSQDLEHTALVIQLDVTDIEEVEDLANVIFDVYHSLAPFEIDRGIIGVERRFLPDGKPVVVVEVE